MATPRRTRRTTGSEIALGATAWHPAARGERQSGPSVGLWPGPCWYSVVLPSVVREGGLSERADAKTPRLEEPRRTAECATTLGSALLQRYWPVTAGASAVGTVDTLSLHRPPSRPLRVQPALAGVVTTGGPGALSAPAKLVRSRDSLPCDMAACGVAPRVPSECDSRLAGSCSRARRFGFARLLGDEQPLPVRRRDEASPGREFVLRTRADGTELRRCLPRGG